MRPGSESGPIQHRARSDSTERGPRIQTACGHLWPQARRAPPQTAAPMLPLAALMFRAWASPHIVWHVAAPMSISSLGRGSLWIAADRRSSSGSPRLSTHEGRNQAPAACSSRPHSAAGLTAAFRVSGRSPHTARLCRMGEDRAWRTRRVAADRLHDRFSVERTTSCSTCRCHSPSSPVRIVAA